MENTGCSPSCEIDLRRIELGGRELLVKGYICARDGGDYRPKEGMPALQLTVSPSAFCAAKCPFCIAEGCDQKRFIDLERLRRALIFLKERQMVRGVSFSGGEPMTDFTLLDEAISLVFETLGEKTEVCVTTNGTNLHRIPQIGKLHLMEAVHISRHHRDDAVNRSLFGIDVPGREALRELFAAVPYQDLFVLNCMLLRGYTGTAEEAHRYLDFAAEIGAYKVSFITGIAVNDFVRSRRVSYDDVLRDDDPSLYFTRKYRDYGWCRCRDGVYCTPEGKLIEFYGRMPGDEPCPYVRGLSFGADNRLRVGYGGEEIPY